MIRRLQILPRWIIFLIDIFICVFTVYLAYFLRLNFNIYEIDFHKVNEVVAIISLINIVIFIVVKAYSGIIRHTGIQDSFRIIVACLLTMLMLGLIDAYLYSTDKYVFISPSIILINFFCSTVLLIAYRLMVKYLYDHYIYQSAKKINVIIYGAGNLGLAARRVIENDSKFNFRVAAFVDNDANKIQKKIDGIPIYGADKESLEEVIQTYTVKQLIIAVEDISPKHRNTIVDCCLENNVHVLTVPPAGEWINGQLRTQQIKDVNIEELLQRDPISISSDILTKQLAGKKLLVTGAAGSIGSEIVRQLAGFKPELIIICDQAEGPLYELELHLKENFPGLHFQSFIGDVRNKYRIQQLFKEFHPQYVYHAAAYKHVPIMEFHPAEAVMNNVLGTINVAELSVRYGVEKFVMISTDKAVNPTNVMGASKRAAEIYIQALNNYLQLGNHQHHFNFDIPANCDTRFITTRFGNVLGSSGSVIPRFKMQIERGGPVTVTHPDITRYFMTIPEACQLVLQAGSMGNGGEIFVFDMGESVKIDDLAKRMISLSGLVLGKDINIVYTGLRPGEKLYEELLNNSENTLPTYHEKIMIAKVTEYDFEQVSFHINDLLKLAQSNCDKEIVAKMKNLIPEYKSNNSVFEELDRELSNVV